MLDIPNTMHVLNPSELKANRGFCLKLIYCTHAHRFIDNQEMNFITEIQYMRVSVYAARYKFKIRGYVNMFILCMSDTMLPWKQLYYKPVQWNNVHIC